MAARRTAPAGRAPPTHTRNQPPHQPRAAHFSCRRSNSRSLRFISCCSCTMRRSLPVTWQLVQRAQGCGGSKVRASRSAAVACSPQLASQHAWASQQARHPTSTRLLQRPPPPHPAPAFFCSSSASFLAAFSSARCCSPDALACGQRRAVRGGEGVLDVRGPHAWTPPACRMLPMQQRQQRPSRCGARTATEAACSRHRPCSGGPRHHPARAPVGGPSPCSAGPRSRAPWPPGAPPAAPAPCPPPACPAAGGASLRRRKRGGGRAAAAGWQRRVGDGWAAGLQQAARLPLHCSAADSGTAAVAAVADTIAAAPAPCFSCSRNLQSFWCCSRQSASGGPRQEAAARQDSERCRHGPPCSVPSGARQHASQWSARSDCEQRRAAAAGIAARRRQQPAARARTCNSRP